MNGPLIKMVGSSKRLGGRSVLNHLDLAVEAGEVVGIIGANGSGKTTLLRLLAGLLYADSGEIQVNQRRVAPGVIGYMPAEIGVLIESPSFRTQFSGLQNLLFLAGIRRVIGRSDITRQMAHFGLDPNNRQAVRKYSLGMRQRLGLTQATMESPHVLLLDELTNSLDQAGVQVLAKTVQTIAARGVAIVLVSHIMDDINAWCDRVFRLEGGTLTVVRSQRPRQWRVVLRRWDDIPRVNDLFLSWQVVGQAAEGPAFLGTGPWTEAAELMEALKGRAVEAVAIERA